MVLLARGLSCTRLVVSRLVVRRRFARGAKQQRPGEPKRPKKVPTFRPVGVRQKPPEEKKEGGSVWLALSLAVGGGSVMGLGLAGAMVLTGDDEPEDDDGDCCCAASCRVARYDDISQTYDTTIGRDEIVMGLPLIRWWLLRSAKGRVLEVACGTGAYLSYYPSGCEITATDASEKMIERARSRDLKNVVCKQGDVQDEDGPYDTIVDAFGLCSFEDPTAALLAMQRNCKPDGTILLLEHGRSHYDWLNRLMDKYAKRHLARWGCSWNRDIEAICRDAELEILTLRRFHFGTTYYVIAKPKAAGSSPEDR